MLSKIFIKKKLLFFVFIFSSFISSTLYAQGGDNATSAAASPITLPFSAAGTTCGKSNDYEPLMTDFLTGSGNDWLYYFCATTTGTVDIMLNNPNTTDLLYPAIMAYSSTPNAIGDNWVASSYMNQLPNLVNFLNGMLTITVTAGQCYYIMIDEDFDNSDFNCYNYNINIQYHVNPPAAPLQAACTNIGYDSGNFNGWIGTSGQVTLGATGAPTPNYTPMYYNTTTSGQHMITSGAGLDPIGGFPVVNPSGGPNSIRLGDGLVGGAAGATLEQKFQVTASNALFVYYYAVVVQDGGTDHTNQEQPFFKTDVFDCNGNPVACGQYLVTGGPGIPGFVYAGSNIYYKTWSPVAVDLTPFIGTCVTVRYTVGDCIKGAHFAYAYIDAVCSPLAITGVNQVCPNKSTTLTAPTGLFTYSWTPGGQTTQSIVVTPTTTTQYSVELTSYTNCKTGLTYTVSLFPQPIASVNSATVCNGTAAVLTSTVNNASTSYSWSSGAGTGANTSVSPSSTSIYTLTFTDSNGCQDTALSRVTVNPIPNVSAISSMSVCNNANVASTVFTGSVTGTTFSWSNSNIGIGLAGSGTASTPPYVATNTGSSPISGVVTVTPSANTCTGTPVSYTVTVNPIPNVNSITSSTYCNASNVAAVSLIGSVTGTSFNWTNSNTSIGLSGSGLGNIPTYVAANTGSSPISGVVTVTPSANTCTGTPVSYTVTVNPTPNVNGVTSSTYCNASNVAAVSLTGSVTGTSFNWTNSNTSIGLSGSGLGNIPTYVATNTGSSPISGVVTVTPSANTCTGTPVSYTVTVNPIPNVNSVTSSTYCNASNVAAVSLTGSVTGTSFNWTNNNTSIGLSGSGLGNIPTYVASNTGSSPISGVVTVTPSANTCTGTPVSYTVTVNPTPNVNGVTSSTYCNASNVAAVSLTGSVTGTSFNWTNSNTSIGLSGSGLGNIPTYVATNTGSSPISGVVTVTPSANTCTGTPVSYTVTVNPTPNVNSVTSSTYCNASNVSAVSLTGSVTGTSFNWTNSNTSIGLSGSGLGNIPTYVANNIGSSPISGVVTVTPSANTCTGTPVSYTVTVNPTPNVTVPSNGVFCSGDIVPAINFTTGISGTNVGWSNTNTTTGLAAFGTGNINAFTSANTTANSIVSVISVTPTLNSCVGTPGTFSITVNPKPVAPTVPGSTVCPGSPATLNASAPGGTYSWYDAATSGNLLNTGSIYTTPGLTTTTSYYVNSTNSFGCVGPMAAVTVTVLNVLAVTASANQTICVGDNAVLNVSPNGTGYIYSWSTATSPNFSAIQNPTVTPAITTIYTVAVTSPNGCTGTSQTQVVVNPLPTANPGTPVAFCTGMSASLGAPAMTGYSYTWTPATGLSNSNLSNPTVSLTNTGNTASVNNYTLVVTLNGCVSSNTVDVTVNPSPLSEAGIPVTLCAQQTGSIGVASTTGYNYSWSPATNLNSSAVANPVVTGVNSGATTQVYVYTVTTTDAATNCQSADVTTVTVLALPSVNAGTAAVTCQGTSSIQLNGSVGGAVSGVTWSGGAGTFNSSNTILNPTYNPVSAEYTNGSVTLTLTANAIAPCQSVSSPVTVSFYPNPVISFTNDNPKGCPMHCVNFIDNSTVSGGETINGWSWNFGDGGTASIKNPNHCYDMSGIYDVTLTVTTNHNCTATLTAPQMIEVYPMPDASFIADPMVTNILEGNVSFQNTSAGATSYYWDFGDPFAPGNNTSVLVNPSHEYIAAGDYVVNMMAISNRGCIDRTSLTIKIEPEFTFYIPNAFSPSNTEGVNDIFTGMGIGIEKYEMWIFDRWGEKIFYTDDIHKGWNGKRNGEGEVVQQDVYVWKVRLKDVFGRYHEYIGHVTLLK